jgi:hypothetical protein
MPIEVHMTKPDIATTRCASPAASATSPSVTTPNDQSHTATPPTETSSRLLLLETVRFSNVIIRVWR